MRRWGLWAAMLFGWTAAGFAHEHWILVNPSASAGYRLATVRICSGHHFPRSEVLLAERLLADMAATGPGGLAATFRPKAADKCWMADLVCDTPGVWTVSFALKRPQEAEPLYRGRCLTVVGGVDDPVRYAAGKGLELVPRAPLSALKPGDTVPVAIHLDGVPVDGKIAVTPEKGNASFISAGRERPAEIRLPAAGAYLLAVSHRGKTFALTFSIAEQEGTAP